MCLSRWHVVTFLSLLFADFSLSDTSAYIMFRLSLTICSIQIPNILIRYLKESIALVNKPIFSLIACSVSQELRIKSALNPTTKQQVFKVIGFV